MLPDSAFNVAIYKKIDQASRLAGFFNGGQKKQP